MCRKRQRPWPSLVMGRRSSVRKDFPSRALAGNVATRRPVRFSRRARGHAVKVDRPGGGCTTRADTSSGRALQALWECGVAANNRRTPGQGLAVTTQGAPGPLIADAVQASRPSLEALLFGGDTVCRQPWLRV